jgi:hypothetical protein
MHTTTIAYDIAKESLEEHRIGGCGEIRLQKRLRQGKVKSNDDFLTL